MPSTAIHDWGDALKTAVANALSLFFGAIPKVLAFAVIVLIGWLIAAALAKVVRALLEKVRFNDLARRSGISQFVEDAGVHHDPSTVLADLVKWFVRLIALVTAFDALGLPAVSQVLQRLLLWLPNLFVALVILVVGGLAAQALARLVRGSATEAKLGNPDLLASLTRYAVWAFAILIAVNQIGVASTLVNTLFMGFVAALALALGLAFGLGGRDTAAEIVRGWYQRSQGGAGQLVTPAQAAQQVEQAAAAANGGTRSPQEAPRTGQTPANPAS